MRLTLGWQWPAILALMAGSAVCLAGKDEAVKEAETQPPQASAAPEGKPAAAESSERKRHRELAEQYGAEVADAIQAGTILKDMTMEQVLLARGAPDRKEVIPPDAELWHYTAGEVAFSGGKVSYVSQASKTGEPSPSQAPTAVQTPRPKPRERPERTDAAPLPALKVTDSGLVNTPGDGFLALRSEPTTQSGIRYAKIPHHTPLRLEECVFSFAKERWCKTTFQGRAGWVLEKYVNRQSGSSHSKE
jgi:hypothetical protein